MFYCFFSIELLIVCLKTFPLETEGVQVGKRTHALGERARSKRTCVHDWGRGSDFSHFGVHMLKE